MNPFVIIGGGVAGLSCAYRLQTLGKPVLLLEQAEHAGGVIQSVRRDGFLFDLGPQSFLSSEALLQFISELGLHGQLAQADPRAPRYVLLHGRLTRVPLAPPELLTTGALSWGTKVKLFIEPFRRSVPPEPDESIAAFVRRKFTRELLENLAAPFVSGVYAGDAEKISLRAAFPSVYAWEKEHGSVLRGAMKSRLPKGPPRVQATLCSFRTGISGLTSCLAEKLGAHLRTGARVASLARSGSDSGARFEVAVEAAGQRETIRAAAVVLASPAYASAKILEWCAPQAAEILRAIEYAPVAVVGLGLRRAQVQNALAGFGYLIPRTAGRTTLGTVWNSSLFPHRAPEGHVTITSFLGGATHPQIIAQGDGEVAATVEREAAAILGITGAPVARQVSRYAQALPQYNLGHTQCMASLRAAAAQIPGLFFAGNYLEGPAISSTVECALRTAEAVAKL